MGDNLAGLLLGQPVIHCSVEMICDLGDLPRGNQHLQVLGVSCLISNATKSSDGYLPT